MTSPLPPLEPTITQLRSLSSDTLLYELNRLENSNKHLVRSNQDMREHDADDQELQMYVTENEKIIERQSEKISLIKNILKERPNGEHAFEIFTNANVSNEGQSDEQTEGHAASANGSARLEDEADENDDDGVYL